VTRGRPLPRVARGPSAAVLAGMIALALAGEASAQSFSREGPSTGVGPFQTTVRPQPRRPDPPAAQAAEEPPLPRLQPMPDDTEPATEQEDEPRRPVAARRTPVDGVLTSPGKPAQPRDGVMDDAEPEAAPDGANPSLLDTRSPEDQAVFEKPPAGFDPDAFSIETDPILDRRPANLFRFEPFAARGFRAGNFTILPEAVFAFAAQDNLFRTATNARRDVALEVRPTVRALSNWRTHAVEFRATGLSSFHADYQTEDDRTWQVEARGRLDVTRRTNIEVLTSYDISQESRGSINALGGGADRTEIATSRANVALNHKFNRVSIQLRGSVTDADYAPSADQLGAFLSNDERDNVIKEGAVRASWEFKPTFSTFAEVAVNTRDYRGVAADGIERDSTGDRTRVGIAFGNSSQVLRGEASIGYGRQRFDDSRLPEIDGVLLDANLAWRLSGVTALLFTARTDVAESQVAGSGGALSRMGALELRHELSRRLIGSAGLRVTQQDYIGSTVSEREMAALLGLEYYVNREVTLFSRYQYVDLDSNVSGRSYDANEVRVGVRVRH
jgi:hypothetical protein